MSRAAGGKRRGWPLAAAVCLTLLLSGCAGTRYRYLSSTSTGTFLKIPGRWQVYQQSQILAHLDAVDPSVTKRQPLSFYVIFDADPTPSLDHDVATAAYPVGLVRVRNLSAEERDTFSLASLRNETVPVDDLLQSDSNSVNAISPARQITHGGLRGSHLEYGVNTGQTTFAADQIGLVDAATDTVWFLIIGCSTTCYRSNTAAIHRIADSWTVKGK
jgi:hypothetical protein